MNGRTGGQIPWRLFVFELIGTALLVLIGLSLVILMFGTGVPVARLIPNEGLRRLITISTATATAWSGAWHRKPKAFLR